MEGLHVRPKCDKVLVSGNCPQVLESELCVKTPVYDYAVWYLNHPLMLWNYSKRHSTSPNAVLENNMFRK